MKSFHDISFKEKIPEVIGLKKEGKSSREIARLLHISTRDITLILKHYSPNLPLDIVYDRVSKERSRVVNKPVKPPEMNENINLTEEDIKAIAQKAFEMLEKERQKSPTPTEKMRKDFTDLSERVKHVEYVVDDLKHRENSIVEWINGHGETHSHLDKYVFNSFLAILIFIVIAWLLLYFEIVL